jgi:hypothetical protein
LMRGANVHSAIAAASASSCVAAHEACTISMRGSMVVRALVARTGGTTH